VPVASSGALVEVCGGETCPLPTVEGEDPPGVEGECRVVVPAVALILGCTLSGDTRDDSA
jgi:hypothetical protein